MKSLVAALCAAVVSTASAQPLPTGQGRVFVSVAPDKNSQARSLSADSFRIWEDGVVREVVSATPAPEPPAIVVIVDGFGRDQTLDARKTLTALVDTLRSTTPQARLALITDVKSTKLSDISSPDLDREAKRFAISGQGLRLFEAIEDACEALRKEATSRRIVLTLTLSTRYDVEERTAAPIVAALKKSGASLWSVDVTPEFVANTQNLHVSHEVENLVTNWSVASGGVHEPLFGTTALAPTVDRVLSWILGQYEVRFARPDVRADSKLQIGVASPNGSRVIGPQWASAPAVK